MGALRLTCGGEQFLLERCRLPPSPTSTPMPFLFRLNSRSGRNCAERKSRSAGGNEELFPRRVMRHEPLESTLPCPRNERWRCAPT